MLRILSGLILALWAGTLSAQCTGQDLTLTLDADERAMLDARVAATPYPQGNFWRADKDGKTIHLIGTVHLYDARLDAYLDAMAPAIRGAGRIFLEMTEVEKKQVADALARDPGLLLLTDGPSLPEMMSSEAWARVAQAAQARGIPSVLAAKLQPWYLSIILSVPPCAMANLGTGGGGLDHLIAEIGAEAGIPMAALEPYDTLFQLFTAEPLEDQVEMMQAGLASARDNEHMFETLLANYFRQDHAAAWELSRILAHRAGGADPADTDAMFDALHTRLLVERNVAWMEHILTAPERHLLVAVGAAHLSGESGLLHQLGLAGYKLTRLDLPG